jgi:Sec-independent protein translocase protein TatA
MAAVMLDISFGELALIVIVAAFVIKPQDVPALIQKITGWIRQFRAFSQQLREQFTGFAGAEEIAKLKEELQEQAKYIRDAEGKLYRSYDISDLLAERNQATTTVPSAAPPPPSADESSSSDKIASSSLPSSSVESRHDA